MMSKSAVKILNSAEQLFNEHSFNSVGVDLIRDASGCSKTTLYAYYKNKNQLVQAVLKTRDQRFRHSLLQAVADHTGVDAIHQIFDWHIDWFQQDDFKGCLFVRAVAESDRQDSAIVQLSQAHKHWVKRLIFKYCPTTQATYYSEVIYTLLEGLIGRFLVDGFDAQIANLMKNSIDALLKPACTVP